MICGTQQLPAHNLYSLTALRHMIIRERRRTKISQTHAVPYHCIFTFVLHSNSYRMAALCSVNEHDVCVGRKRCVVVYIYGVWCTFWNDLQQQQQKLCVFNCFFIFISISFKVDVMVDILSNRPILSDTWREPKS